MPVVLTACWLAAWAAGLRPRPTRILAGAVAVLLLTVSATAFAVASELPQQMRAAGRTAEFAVRLALGASHGRLTLQAVAELVPTGRYRNFGAE